MHFLFSPGIFQKHPESLIVRPRGTEIFQSPIGRKREDDGGAALSSASRNRFVTKELS